MDSPSVPRPLSKMPFLERMQREKAPMPQNGGEEMKILFNSLPQKRIPEVLLEIADFIRNLNINIADLTIQIGKVET